MATQTPRRKIYTSAQKPTFGDHVIRMVHHWRRTNRVLFPSPAEVKFVRIMKGHVLTIPFIKSKRTGFCLTIVWRGRILKRELVHREVPAGPFFIDYAVVTPFYKRGIELHGFSAHIDIVADQERDEYLKAHGWQMRYVTAKHLREPKRVFAETLKFLKS
jgi:very-short-patch-repair endonuclease